MPPSVATRTREADVDTRVTLATRLERPASTARDGRSGSDSIKQHAATGEVTAPHLRRVVSEEDIEAAELMCSLRDVVDTPPTCEEVVVLVPEPRATTRIGPTPTTESRGRRGKHPAKKNIPKSLVDPRGGGGGGRVESLLTRARGIERQLTPRIPARYGSITEALAYIDAQPPADIELEKHIGRKSVRRKAKRRGRFEIPDNDTRGDANSPKNDPPPRSPSPPGTAALDSFVTPKPSPPGTPTETPPAHKRLGSVRAFLARSGELLERLTADGAEEELVEDGKAGEMEEVREVKPAGPSDSPRNRAGSILDVPPKKRRRVHAPTFEPGCARARPFVRRGDVGDEDVAVYRPDPDFDPNDVKIPGGDPHAWRWSTEQRSAVSPPNLLHDTSNVKTREVQRLMLPCVVASTKDGGDSMDAKRRAASSAAMNSTSGPVSPVGSVSVSPTTADERVAERRRLRSDATRVLSASSPAGSPPQPFSQPFSQQPLLTAPANPPSPMTKAAREKAVAAEHERCKNLAPFFRVDRSRISGLGVYATVPLPAKCMALEYVGEVITNAEADLREELEKAEIVKAAEREGRVATACELARAATYMFTLDPAVGTIVDATRMGNITRFVNHCCEPNCVTRSVKVGGSRKIVLVTQRDVAAGEELTYDYKFKPDTPENEAPCDCGADRCRGIINVR